MIYNLRAPIVAIMLLGAISGIFGIFAPINSVPAYAESCDPTLWDHVYHQARLNTIKTCITVTGIIDHNKSEPDGDHHIRVHLDPQYSDLVNSANENLQAGDLVVEPICDHEPAGSTAAIDSCAGYQSQVVIPPEGTHVQITGRYVLDTKHGWTEIHPVSDISNLDSSTSPLEMFGVRTAQPPQQHVIPPQRQHVPQDNIPDD
jgi:hypothetical protein